MRLRVEEFILESAQHSLCRPLRTGTPTGQSEREKTIELLAALVNEVSPAARALSPKGDQLNKFVREQLDYFLLTDEWDDFVELVTQSNQRGGSPLNWHDTALTELFNYTNGHPYFAKLLCAKIFDNAVATRDTEVTVDEVKRAQVQTAEALDVNAFAHFWKDGIPSGPVESEVIELKRCRTLVAIARALRKELTLSDESIAKNRTSAALAESEVSLILADFVRRDVLSEKAGRYEFVLPLFQQWLETKGMGKLISDTLGDELSNEIQKAEDAAYVTPVEVVSLLDSWPLYKGHRVTSDEIRAWLNQRESQREQRLLFTLLKGLRFFGEDEIREKLRTAHSIVKTHTSAFTPANRSQRRNDIAVTYVDGPAKSGSKFAEKYVEVNLISTQCVLEPHAFASQVDDYEKKTGITINGVVIIDDIAATGRSLADNVGEFVQRNLQFLSDRNITLVVVALVATKKADEAIRKVMQTLPYKHIDFRSCEILEKKFFAFEDSNGLWADADDRENAKKLAQDIGREIYADAPFGFGSLGLLVAFFDGCPNNTLPILHASMTGVWRPLLARSKN